MMKTIVLIGLSVILGMGIGGIFIGRKMVGIIYNKQFDVEKFRKMYHMIQRWMATKQEGKFLETYFEKNKYQRIAIYGMADIGVLLINELKDTAIEVVYGIDKNHFLRSAVPLYHPDQELLEVDAVVVTAIAYFDSIEKMLSEKLSCPILSLEDVIYELLD